MTPGQLGVRAHRLDRGPHDRFMYDAEFIVKNGLNWPQSLYRRNGPHSAFGFKQPPAQAIVNHEGVIVYKAVLWSDRRYDELNRAIGKALDELKKAKPAGTAAPASAP